MRLSKIRHLFFAYLIITLPLSAFAQTSSFDPEKDVTLGSTDAPHELVFYFSPGCPSCIQDIERKLPRIVTDYVEPGELRIIFREIPDIVANLSTDSGELQNARQTSWNFGFAMRCSFEDGGSEAYLATLGALIAAMKEVLPLDAFIRFPYLPEGILPGDIFQPMIAQGVITQERYRQCGEPPLLDNIRATFERHQRLHQQAGGSSVPAYVLDGELVKGLHENASPRLLATLEEVIGEPAQ